MKIPDKKYIFHWAEENEAYCDSLYALKNYGQNSVGEFGFGSREIALVYQDYSLEFYLTAEELERSSENGFAYFSNPSNVESFLSASKNNRDQAKIFLREAVTTDLFSLNNEEFDDFHIRFGKIVSKIFTYYTLTQPEKFKKIELVLREYLEGKNAEDKNEAMRILVQAEEEIEVIKEGVLFESLNDTIKKGNYQGGKDLLNDPYVLKKVDQKERNEFILKYKIDKDIDVLSKNLALLSIERIKMRFIWMKFAFIENLIMNRIEKITGVGRMDLRFYTSEELIDLQEKGTKISSDILKIREKGMVVILDNDKIMYLSPEESQSFIKKVRENNKKTDDKIELKGSIASAGKVKGKAVILSFRNAEDHPEKIAGMKRGDIIVSEMTKPSIMIACEKAGGIVTDEGGILCHAAIVSRELGIPCVIGTIKATQLFKDGDEIEIDANEGIVRKF